MALVLSPDNGITLNGTALEDTVENAISPNIQATDRGFKNILINGAMDIWQRGTTKSIDGYIADRFRMTIYSGGATSSRVVSGLDNFYYAYRISNNTGVIEFEQRLEGTSIPNGVDSLTLSFWVRGNKDGTVRTGRIINGDTGATNTGYGYIDVNTSWVRKTITTTACPTASNDQYYRAFILDDVANYLSSSADWLEITGIQLELGSTATPFEHRPYGLELDLCKRYYQTIHYRGNSATGTYYSYYNRFYGPQMQHEAMRVKPTITYDSSPTSGAFYWVNPGVQAYSANTSSGFGIDSGAGNPNESGSFTFYQDRTSGGASPGDGGSYRLEASLRFFLDAEL